MKSIYAMFLLFSVIIACLVPQDTQSCTSFCFETEDQLLFGRSFDWHVGNGLVIVNKGNVSKTAWLGAIIDQPVAAWTSKYGSITFNQVGRELPFGGINEAGLVVEELIFRKGRYPSQDSRPAIGYLQWIQYQLDNYSTVDEVLSSDSHIMIFKSQRRNVLHYIACDRGGNCAIIEFIDGKMVYHTKKTMPVKVITNTYTYEQSIEYLSLHTGFGGKFPIPTGTDGLHRFTRAANLLKNYDPKTFKSAMDCVFNILSSVKQYTTLWNIVYDMKNFRIYFRTSENHKIRYFDLRSFDFSCDTPVKVLDINAELSGNVTKNFLNYTKQVNRSLVQELQHYYNNVSEESIELISQAPERTFCIR